MPESAIASELAHELRTPEGPEDLSEILESLPGLMEILASRMGDLASWMGDNGLSDGVRGSAEDLSGMLSSCKDGADSLWEVFSADYEFWLRR